MNMHDHEEKRKIEEYRKNPMANAADSINQSIIGNWGVLTRASAIVVLVILAVIFFLLKFFGNG